MDDDEDDDDDDEEELPKVSVTKKKSERQLELEQGDDYKIGEKNAREEGATGCLPLMDFKKVFMGVLTRFWLGGIHK